MRTSRRMKNGASRRKQTEKGKGAEGGEASEKQVSIMQKVSCTTTTRHLELDLYNRTRDRQGEKENKRGSSVSRQVERERD